MQEDVRKKFDTLYVASRRQIIAPWTDRADRLERLRTLIRVHRAALAAAIHADFGNRPAQETELAEVFPSLEGIAHALKHGRGWMRERRRETGRWFRPARSRLVPQPLGVVGIVVPWNYPLFLAVGPLTSALVAGNRAMLKQSEFAPRFAELFAGLLCAHFTSDEIAVVNGDAEVARAFTMLPFDHLLFTGSTDVGRKVMGAASANLTPVTLELGGKSPAIIGPEADFDQAVERIVVGKTINAGQTCTAPDYVLVPEGHRQRFVDTARRVFNALYPDMARNLDYASVVTPRHLARLLELVADARQRGARVVPLSDGEVDASTRQLALVLLTDVDDTMRATQEEIFGPVLPVIGYASIDDAVAYVNARPRPLALYLFDTRKATTERVLAQTVSGGVCVNDTLLHAAQHDLPFGGVGASGMGAYHGEHGFEALSHMKPVFHQTMFNALRLFKPPYGRTFALMMKLLTR